MHVPSQALRSVIFIGSKDDDGKFKPRATGFLVYSHSRGDQIPFGHLVTAKHAIEGMLTAGMAVYCRVNLIGGGSSVESLTSIEKWWFCPDDEFGRSSDIAVAFLELDLNRVDHDYIPIPEYAFEETSGYTKQRPRLGDEVFTIGLFVSHFGKSRNRPIVRIGNVAAMPEEPVFVPKGGYIDAYLIEARSISGLNGSPVFVNVPESENLVGYLRDPRFRGDPEAINWQRYHFLGLISAHFDLERLNEDTVVEDADKSRGINAGIGIVVPATKVIETLYQPEFKKLREKQLRSRTHPPGP
jgi:hypothetical protein